MSVLVIDDDSQCRKNLSTFLNQYGYKVTECSDWKEAINIIKQEDVSFILANKKITNSLLLRFPSGKNSFEYIVFSGKSKKLTNDTTIFKALYTEFFCDQITKSKNKKLKNKIKIIAVDQNKIIRFGIKAVLENVSLFEFIGGASNFSEAKKLIKKCPPDILLLGTNFYETHNFNQWKYIKQNYPNIHFIILTANNIIPPFILKDIYQWTDGILLKNSSKCDLMYTIAKVIIGGKVLDPLISKKMFQFKLNNKLNSLTEQELKILYNITLGKTNKQLAKELCLSPSTIRNYISKILHKLNLSNRSAAVAYGFKVFS